MLLVISPAAVQGFAASGIGQMPNAIITVSAGVATNGALLQAQMAMSAMLRFRPNNTHPTRWTRNWARAGQLTVPWPVKGITEDESGVFEQRSAEEELAVSVW